MYPNFKNWLFPKGFASFCPICTKLSGKVDLIPAQVIGYISLKSEQNYGIYEEKTGFFVHKFNWFYM